MSILTNQDSREVHWESLLVGPVDCIITDPPYGVDYQSKRGVTAEAVKMSRRIDYDESVQGAIEVFKAAIGALTPVLADEVEMYVFTRWDIIPEWTTCLKELGWGFVFKMMLIWDKGALAMGDIDASWGPSYEPILYAKRGRRDLNYQRSSVLSFSRVPPAQRIHPTEKPVSLLEELLKVSTNKNDIVVDPFAGSASTLVAADNLGRQAWGVEMDEERFFAANNRLSSQLLF